MTAAVRTEKQAEKHKFLIVDRAQNAEDRFARPIFSCETLAEAIRVCDKMNSAAGLDKFIVRAA